MRAPLLLLLASVTAHAGAFDTLKALAGSWTATESGKKSKANFEAIARGTAVKQTSGFTAIYFPDHDAIGMMLFPDNGNPQRFACASKETSLECTFAEEFNSQPGLGHFRGVTINFAGKKSVQQTWIWQDAKGDTLLINIDLKR